MADVKAKNPADFKLVGKPQGLKVSQAKSSGQQTYAMDVRLPGMDGTQVIEAARERYPSIVAIASRVTTRRSNLSTSRM